MALSVLLLDFCLELIHNLLILLHHSVLLAHVQIHLSLQVSILSVELVVLPLKVVSVVDCHGEAVFQVFELLVELPFLGLHLAG